MNISCFQFSNCRPPYSKKSSIVAFVDLLLTDFILQEQLIKQSTMYYLVWKASNLTVLFRCGLEFQNQLILWELWIGFFIVVWNDSGFTGSWFNLFPDLKSIKALNYFRCVLIFCNCFYQTSFRTKLFDIDIRQFYSKLHKLRSVDKMQLFFVQRYFWLAESCFVSQMWDEKIVSSC